MLVLSCGAAQRVRGTEVNQNMTNDDIADEIRAVKEAAPEADEAEIRAEFERYQNEFLIPPKNALRSVMKKFQDATGVATTTTSGGGGGGGGRPPAKKVDRFADLAAEDKNVTIEVEVITYTPRTTMVRGEERQTAFGWIEDNPWADGGERVRWDFKDWGNHAESLIPGAIVRLEGVSVNEWKGKRSLNVNQSSRVAVLKESGRTVAMATSDPIDIGKLANMEGFATVTGRVIAKREQTITKRDGSGTMDIVKGRIADKSGSIGFVSWGSFEHEVGALIRIENAAIRRFRDTPELNIGDRTKIETFIDTNFGSLDELAASSALQISQLRDGSRDVNLVVQLSTWSSRTFTNQAGEEKTVWGGDVIDPTGQCRLTAWAELPIDDSKLPLAIRLENVRVRAWQGTPDITVDDASQVTVLDALPWEALDASTQSIEVDLTSLVNGASRRGIRTVGTAVQVRNEAIIRRCPECRRAMRDGACGEHGPQEGNVDMRLRFIIDDGVSNTTVLLNRQSAEAFLGKSMEEVEKAWVGGEGEKLIAGIRTQLIGRPIEVHGRIMVDAQGSMIMADEVAVAEVDAEAAAAAVRAEWGVVA